MAREFDMFGTAGNTFTAAYTVPSFSLEYTGGSHKGPNPPKYCRKCSAIMRLKKSVTGYTSDKCEPVYKVTTSCPNYSVWDSLLGRTAHDRAEEDSHGDWPWV